MTALREKRPRGSEWVECRDPYRGTEAATEPSRLACSTWTDGLVLVVSALELAELPDGSGRAGEQWHISISRGGGKRAKPHDVRRALRAFGMVSAEEDNHEPGSARNFWMPVDPAARVDCECKTDEDQIVTDGHRWSNPKDPAECRGCQFERLLGKPCPLHRSAEEKRA
ncbi:MAG TPA: hypothetical protein VGK73_38710 [Polyangiaceae bacterium]